MNNTYTVKQLAKLAGISPRTLHHYDQIGLLKPATIGDNGYRYYQHDQLIRLMQILFYRELDFSLEDIRRIITDPSFNLAEAIYNHRHLLKLQLKRTQRLIRTLDQLALALEGNKTMNTTTAYQSFDQKEINQYKDEVKARWGHTDAYSQSQERIKNWTKEDFDRIKKQGHDISIAIAELMDKPISDAVVQARIKDHHAFIENFYDCSYDMYRGLGEMYFADPRFAKTYNQIKPGLAKFMRDAIAHYCQISAKK